jgi:hypothetical protein
MFIPPPPWGNFCQRLLTSPVQSCNFFALKCSWLRNMRDVATSFYCGVLRKLVASDTVLISGSVLIVCGGPLDEAVMAEAGFANVKVTNIDGVTEPQDAEHLICG